MKGDLSMYSKVKVFGHPVHPMLVSFPIAFYTATLACFIVYSLRGDLFWFRAAYALNIAGVVMALVAASAGFIDLIFGIPANTDAKRHGYQHMGLNLAALAFFAVNIALNSGQWNSPLPVMRFAILLPALGLLCTLAAGYLGWTLVQTHHVGVQLTPAEQRCVEQETQRRKRAA
jgi:uncharacterized membrane protein